MATPKFAHIVMQTAQLQDMRSWYCTVLDAHVVFENEGLSFITFDDEHHRVAFLAPPIPLEQKSPATACMHHSAYTFATLEELLERWATLRDEGIEPVQPIQHGVTTSLYYRDPDKNFVELQVDNFDTPEKATAYMKGPEYAGDAVGVGFSPALMLEALKAGTPASVLQTRKWALETTPDMPNPLIALTSP